MSAEPATLLLQQSGEETVDGFEYEEIWQVFTTQNTDTGITVLTAANLPLFGSAFAGDVFTRVSSRQPQQQSDSQTHWHVRVRYTRQKGSDQDKQNPPTLRPVKRAAKTVLREWALFEDRNGDPILTSAKTPFNPPLVTTVANPVVTFQRWESTFTSSIIQAYVWKVNSATFGAWEPGYVRCNDISATEEWEQNADGELQRYWLVTYEFEANTFKWNPHRVLDADVWFLDPDEATTADKRKPIYIKPDGTYTGNADEGVPVPSPVPLDSSGNVITQDNLPDDAHYLEFDIYEEANFNALGLNVN